MKSRLKKRRFLMLYIALVLVLSSSVTAFAQNTTQDADKKLREYVYDSKAVKNSDGTAKDYALSGGGTIPYKNSANKAGLVTPDGLVTDNFNNLTSKSKQQLLTDMLANADAAVVKENIVTDQTKSTWLGELQTCNGVGTQLMTTLLQNTKPDYVTANRIYEPWSGIVGTAMALGAILIMACLGLTMVADLGYIGLPWFRLLLDGEGDSSGQSKPKFISFEALSAVQMVENGTGGSGQQSSSFKVAAGIYLKRRIIMLIILGVCLLYLVQGQIFVLVGWILDLLSGFLGF